MRLRGGEATLLNPASHASSSHEAVPFLTPSITTVPTSGDSCNCLSSDTDIYLSLTVSTDSRIPIREDAVIANASVGRPQTLLFVAEDLRVPPCEDARGAHSQQTNQPKMMPTCISPAPTNSTRGSRARAGA